MKLVEPTGRRRGWHVNHGTGSRSRAHAWVWGTKSPRSERFNEIAYAWLKEKLT